ncbi:hypothetical protein, partial [Bacillus thuringiensis]|uniref:hypothetical protein n=1 Tax=Bacillus thuringiensis TaxID=1428 RepID=UPI00284B97F7
RLIEPANLTVYESALPGASVPVDTDAIYHPSLPRDDQVPLVDHNPMAFLSPLLPYGRLVGVAVEPGINSQIGQLATLFHE